MVVPTGAELTKSLQELNGDATKTLDQCGSPRLASR